ncbi:MAG: glycosyltransferase family 2 protein [Bryobacteraceae bacterium]
MTVAIPTLAADERLEQCVASLVRQTWPDLEIVVVDNSGRSLARSRLKGRPDVRVIESAGNQGFGAAVNRAWRESTGDLLATLNDDAVAAPGWAEALARAIQQNESIGMCASQVRMAGEGVLDSAGLRIARDGSSKQRGQSQPPREYGTASEVLCPSGSAALYRRTMIDQIGGFDEDFFLYCEDTDLGLRACRAGWSCLYVPEAVVEHEYSRTAGRVSDLKAYLVERNRLRLAVKNFPVPWLAAVPWYSLLRYFWHAVLLAGGRGTASRYSREGGSAWRLIRMVLKAHGALLAAVPKLLRQRGEIARRARMPAREFIALMRRHEISVREVAEL